MAVFRQTSDDSGEQERQMITPAGLFPDNAKMKDEIRKQIAKPEYDVANFYKKTGAAQYIARHPTFEKVTLLVIGLNAIWIAVDTDWNKQSVLLHADPVFQFAEHLFCIYFAFEWTMRFIAFEHKRNCFRDFWFVFDSALVSTMVLETWLMTSIMAIVGASGSGGLGNASVLRMARLLRLTRMARMARLLRAMPELLILIKGMVAAMRSVMFTLGLLTVIIYLFAIAFTQLCESTPCALVFSSVIESMHYLLVKGALMDGVGDVTKVLEPQSIPLLIVFYIYVLLASLTVMNMLIGVICEVVSAVAEREQEVSKVGYVKEKIEELMAHGVDDDGDNKISKDEFKEILTNRKALSILQEVGVDVVSLPDFTDNIFEEDEDGQSKTLNFEEFMNVILDLRGSNSATVKDIVQLRSFMNSRIGECERKMLELEHGHRFDSWRSVHKTVSHSHSTSNKSERVHRCDEAPRLRRVIDESLKELLSLHESEVLHLRAENAKLQAKLSQIAELPPLRSLAHVTGADAAAIASEHMKTADSVSIEMALSQHQGMPAVPPLCPNKAGSLSGNNDQCSNSWAMKAATHPTQQPLNARLTETIPNKTIIPAGRGGGRVHPNSNCLPQPHSAQKLQVCGTAAEVAWGTFNQEGPRSTYNL